MAQASAQARWEALHEDAPYHDGSFTSWDKKRNAGHPFHRDEGVRIWVAPVDLSPDDHFLDESEGDPFGDSS